MRMIKIITVSIIGLIVTYLITLIPYGEYFLALLSGLIMITIFLSKKDYNSKLAWMLLMAIQPVVGLLLYTAIGKSRKEITIFRKKRRSDRIFNRYNPTPELVEREENTYYYDVLKNVGRNPIYDRTNTDVLTNGINKFPKLIECLESAQSYIHMEYYIIKSDELGMQIRDILIRKAQEGVEVRVLYDDLGCMQIDQDFIAVMRKAGIRVSVFGQVNLTIMNDSINYRNHRKVVVIDNKYGFTGGLNIGNEYLYDTAKYGFWRDTHLFIEGEALRSLQLLFAKDWYFVTKENFIEKNPDKYLSFDPYYGKGEGFVQIVPDGPDTSTSPINDLYFKLFTTAKKKIWIATPYLIPTREIIEAIKTAKLMGVDVKILMPGIPDKKMVYYASQSYYDELLAAGVEIYQYRGSFLHAKVVIVDDIVAAVGTANMDMRSLHTNFEVTTFIYKSTSIIDLVKDFQHDITQCDKIELAKWDERGFFKRIGQLLAQLASPLF